ncbi:MAG: DUF167 domain-containing protein [Alphaproteobacteria bacterium]|nr:DUF167 domain-containing protein [Alphaproteobacteria bacterium]
MFFAATKQGTILRVRLTPNSCVCKVIGIFTDPMGDEYLKISVNSPPQKGRANAELIKFLSRTLDLPKSDFTIISGELDRYKKILITSPHLDISKLADINSKGTSDDSTNS